MVPLLVALFVLALILFSLWLPVSITIQYDRRDKDDEGYIAISWLFGIVHIRRRLTHVETTVGPSGPAVRISHRPVHGNSRAQAQHSAEKRKTHSVSTADVWRFLREWREWEIWFKRMRPIVTGLLRRMHILRLRCHLQLGTGDVVTSGMTCGTLWALASTGVGVLSHLCKLEQMPDLQIQPNFQRAAFESSLLCIAEVRAGYAIGAGVRLIRVWRRRQTDGTPNPGTHADSHVEHS